jgi:polyvinyl alcohol dehydrogenase (cytochrome)
MAMKLRSGSWFLAVVAMLALTIGCKSKDAATGHAGAAVGAAGRSAGRNDSGESVVTRAGAGGHSLGDVGSADASIADAGTVDAAVASDAGKVAKPNKPAAGSGGKGGAAGAGGSSVAASGDVPCPVAKVLDQHCAHCHGATPSQGAPFSLVDAASFQRDLGGQSVGAAALKRIVDASRPMPPPPAARLSDDEVATLRGWIESGGKPDANGCKVQDSQPPAAGPVLPDAGQPALSDAGQVEPPDAASPPSASTSDWTMFGFDLANSRNVTGEATLSTDNVSTLHELWRFNGPSTTSAPAVLDDVVYLPGWDGNVYALAVDDGSKIWTAQLPHLIDSSPTVTDTQVFVSDDHGAVHALDRSNGNVQWSTQVDDHEETHLWSSPIYVPSAGLIVLGIASGEEQTTKTTFTFRGGVVGLDAATGEQRFRFDTASPDDGSGPGVGSWSSAAVDEARALMFIGTGNNYQPPSSPYSDSLLAIELGTGSLAWAKQFTANDTYTVYGTPGVDYDIGSSPNLISLDGKDFVGVGVKSGFYFLLDRDSGAQVWSTSLTLGSQLGGVISASAYADGSIFVASNEFVADTTSIVSLAARDGHEQWRYRTPNLTYGGLVHVNGVLFAGTTDGLLLALDGATGAVLWADNAPSGQPIAGSPTWARGRLFVPWGYQWTLRQGTSGTGGMTVYGL